MKGAYIALLHTVFNIVAMALHIEGDVTQNTRIVGAVNSNATIVRIDNRVIAEVVVGT